MSEREVVLLSRSHLVQPAQCSGVVSVLASGWLLVTGLYKSEAVF